MDKVTYSRTFEEEAALYEAEARAEFAKETEGCDSSIINEILRRGMRVIGKARQEIANRVDVVFAQWLDRSKHNDYIWAECSNCGFREENWKVVQLGKSDTDYVGVKWNYCPKCGACMTGGQQNV